MQAEETAVNNQRGALLARCAGIGTATWSDAMDELGIDGGICSGLTQRSGGAARCCGYAVPARAQAAGLGAFEGREFGLDRMLAAAGPQQVLAVELGGAEVSAMGGIGALAARGRGIAGVLIDGACRDVDEIGATGLWLATRHVTPRTGKRRVRLDEIGAPALVGGVRVRQDDLVVGDATGIVVVPHERMLQVLELAEAMAASDSRKEAALRAGKNLQQARESAGS
ncbi:MAG TPA: RraA family protein [Burkholderiales bacterium]|jgi:regulator of RNase E activity RraA|nr:RraA family protein [Burkholderiales bacterium]